MEIKILPHQLGINNCVIVMPSAPVIRCKSGLTPANTLRAFRFHPYCFASPAATHIEQATQSHRAA